MVQKQMQCREVSLEEAAAIIEGMQISASYDLGASLHLCGRSEVIGDCMIMTNTEGRALLTVVN